MTGDLMQFPDNGPAWPARSVLDDLADADVRCAAAAQALADARADRDRLVIAARERRGVAGPGRGPHNR